MSRRFITGIIVLILIVGAVFGYQQLTAGGQESQDDLETTTVERGTLIASVSASGTIEAERRMALTFKTPGRVAEIYVETGDQVSAGDPLVQLDTEELELQVAQAQAGLTIAEAQLAQLEAGALDEDLAAAEAGYESAQAQLEKLRAGPEDAEVEAARANVESAQRNLSKVLSGPTQFEKDRTKRDLDQAKNQLYSAQSQRDAACGQSLSSAQCDQAEAQVLIAQVSVDQAAAVLEELKTQPDAAAVASARAQYAQAQAQLRQLVNGASEAELASAQAQVSQAKAQLEKLKVGARNEERAVSQAQIEQARVGLRQAELALKNATLTAPIDGTVAQVGTTEGELISQSQPAVVLINMSGFKIDLAIDETDIGKIKTGQPVTISLDAFPDEELTGEVMEVSPAGTATQGIVTYSVTVRPDPTDVEVKPGMTAGVDIVVAEKENVLLVPNRAIRTEQGKRVVVVPSGEGTRTVEVEIGLRNEQVVEITSGLSEGDRVVTSVVPTNQALEGGFFGGN